MTPSTLAKLNLVRDESGVGEIAFVDLPAQQRRIREAVETRLSRVLDHGRYIGGPELDELEAALITRTGAKVAISCASGTAALIIALLSRGLKSEDAVFVPAFTYNATVNAVLLAGATPIFVDIDPDTYNIDPADLAAKVESIKKEGRFQPKAVIPVDLFGSPADYNRINALAEREGLFVLGDGAQSFGGRYNNRDVGNLAAATAVSFFPGKAFGAYGDAGAVFSQGPDDQALYESIRWHGTDDSRKISVRVGFNGRMDSFQAAVLLEKLAIFDEELEVRRHVAATYDECLSAVAQPQHHLPGAVSGCGYYALRVKDRERVIADLSAAGVPTAVYYSTPLHKMPVFEPYAPEAGLPNTDLVAAEILSLPMHGYLTERQVDYICDAVTAALR
ncbi:MAG: DegT/DnrJ/EryC1/StrS aminotransferase family protein [Pseudomonadota bacterium]